MIFDLDRFFSPGEGGSGIIGSMRIIAGTKRGMTLLSPKTRGSRPITDRVKESLFSVLHNYDLPDGAIVADLFAGVGSLGLEALSRGAEFVTFVEKDPAVIRTLNRNIERAGFAEKSRVVRTDAFKAAPMFGSGEKDYSLVFVDPPYSASKNVQADSPLSGLLDLWVDQVASGGLVVARTSRQISLLDQYGPFRVIERRVWGTMAVAILARSETR